MLCISFDPNKGNKVLSVNKTNYKKQIEKIKLSKNQENWAWPITYLLIFFW